MERLPKGREQLLLAEYQASVRAGRPNLFARNELVERHLPLVRSAARSLWLLNQQHVEFEDLAQAGFVGLIEAIERFDLSKGTRLSTYALPWIRNAIHQAVRQYRWDRRITEETYRAFWRLNSALAKQPVRFDHSIDYESLARDSRMDAAYCHRLLAWTQSRISFETPLTKNGKLRLEDTLDDRGVMRPEQNTLLLDAKELVAQALASEVLSDDERNAVAAVFFEDDEFFRDRKGSKKAINDALRYRIDTAIRKLRNEPLQLLQRAQALFDAANATRKELRR